MPKQKDGRYRAKITVGKDATGKPIVKYVSGKTKRELEENKAELRRVYREGIEDVSKSVVFGVYAREWLRVYKLPGLSKSSQELYECALEKHLIPAFGDRQLRAMRPAELQDFLNGRSNYSQTSNNYVRRILKGVFSQAHMEGVISRDPTLNLTRTGKKPETKRALTDAETVAVLRLIDRDTLNQSRLLAVLYYTGVRRGEALGLQWRDVDFSKKILHIRRDVDFKTNSIGALKNDGSMRDVPIPEGLLKYLDGIRGIGETHIICSERSNSFVGASAFADIWRGIIEDIKTLGDTIECNEKTGLPVLTPHYFRHNYASLLYNAGEDVLTMQRYLGHTDAKTTLAIYSHLSDKNEAQSADKVNDIFKKVAKKLPGRKTGAEGQKTKSHKP